MNQLTKNRSLNIIVIILLVANIVSFGIFWWRQSSSEINNQIPPPRMSKGGDYLTNELKFSAKQQNAFEALRSEHRNTVDPIRKEIEQFKNDFFGLVKNDTVSESTINNAWNNIASSEKEMELITLNHFKAVRKICDSGQKIKFDQIIQEAIMRIHNRPQGPPPPQGHNPPPDGQRPQPDGQGPPPEGQRPPPPDQY